MARAMGHRAENVRADGKDASDHAGEQGSEEASEEVELALDEYGRVAGTSDCGLDFSFQARLCPVSLEGAAGEGFGDAGTSLLDALRRDCDALFGSEDSFWLPAGMMPRCALERLAADVFRFHTRNVRADFDFDGSGAEWWVQVREDAPAGHGGAAGSIGFHWDKDEDLVDSCGLSLHPQLSTVTYLSTNGAPTMVCDCRSVPTPDYDDDDDDDRRQQSQQQQQQQPHYGDFHEAYLSHPVCQAATPDSPLCLKHIAFDGQLLHGAPAEFGRPSEGRRYTFLVNVWLGYSPLGLSPIEEESIETANLSRLPIHFSLDQDDSNSSPSSSCRICTTAGDSNRRFESTFGPTGTEHVVSFGTILPPARHSSATNDDDVEREDHEHSSNNPSCCTLRVDLSAAGAEGRFRPAPRVELTEVPSIESPDATWEAVRDRYRRAQILIVRGGALPVAGGPPLLGISSLRRLYAVDPEAVAKTWNVEYGPSDDSTTAEAILSTAAGNAHSGDDDDDAKAKRLKLSSGRAAAETTSCEDIQSPGWYVSFVLNQSRALDAAKEMLPFLVPACFEGSSSSGVSGNVPSHTSNVWFFFGRNHASSGMSGRAEHTDKISHSGTWHAQQSGSKVWFVRPFQDEEEWAAAGAGRYPCCSTDEPLRAELHAGDLLLVNTRLWRHRTEIPSSASAADGISFSYARDFYLDGCDEESADGEVDMTNLDDIWATDAIAQGTEVADIGDDADLLARFATSDDPNCRLQGPAGDVRVVAARAIAAGESLTLPEGSALPT